MPKLSIVLFRDSDFWVAVCLESFMAVKDAELPGVIAKMNRVVQEHIEVAKIEGVTPFECFPPAPQEYWDKYQAASWQLSSLVAATPEPSTELRVAA